MQTELHLPPSAKRWVLVDQDTSGEDAWLAARQSYLTASDLYTWTCLDKPSWWSTSRKDVIREKLTGAPRKFKPKALRVMAHGRFNERHNLEKFCTATGVTARPDHSLLGHGRWPFLACTLDAIAAPIISYSVDETFFSVPELIDDALSEAQEIGGIGLIELKQTSEYGGKKWLNGDIPDWYLLQPQMQMAFAEVEWCLMVCQIGADNMVAHCMARDPGFADLLDEVNDEFGAALAKARAA